MIPDIILFPGGEVWVSTYPGSYDFELLEAIRAEGYSPPRGPGYGARTGRSSPGGRSSDRQPWRDYHYDESGEYGPDFRNMSPGPDRDQAKRDMYARVWNK